MKRIALANRILSLGLAVALAASSPMSVYAGEDTDASVETSIQISEGATSGDGGSSDVSDGSESGQPESGDALSDASQAADTQTDGNGVVNTIADEIKNDIANEGTPAADTPVVDADEKASDDEAGETPTEDGEEVTDEETKPEDAEPTSEEEDAEKCEHVFGDWTSNEDGTHSRTCSECGEVETETCDYDEDGVCKICGYKKAEEDPEIEYTYTSNGDGTHTKKWVTIDEEGNEVPHEEIEECEFDENGICIHCGQEKVEEKGKKSGTFEESVDGYTVTVEVPEGAFETNVELKVTKIELSEEEKELVDSEVAGGIVSSYETFDICFVNSENADEEIEPSCSVSVKITSPLISESSEIVHIDDDGVAENITTTEVVEGEVKFEAETFSKYTIAGVELDLDANQILYYNSAYGNAYTDQIHESTTRNTVSGNKYGVQFRYSNASKAFAPADNKYFIYGKNDGNINLHIEAPANYYIKEIKVKVGSNTKQTITPSGGYATTYTGTIALEKNKQNVFILDLQKIPITFTNQNTVVAGATIVNYVDSSTVFGDTFKFGGGGMTGESNICHYGQIYQGLGKSDLGSSFSLVQTGGKDLFPSSVDSSYITSLYRNVGVQFKKDNDGYWTLDSSSYKYVYDPNNKTDGCNGVIIPQSGTGFWPFKVKNKDNIHYGMELPITFNVNESGTTINSNGVASDTIFKFAGDDDVFVYIDGKLVLDIGGIHNAVSAQINFKTGEILYQGDSTDTSNYYLTSSVDGSVYKYSSGISTNLYNIVSENNVSEFSKKDHKLVVVYFERGGNRANCKISFNFEKNETTTINYEGLKVKKNSDGTYSGLAGATFTLYNNENCTEIAKMALGQDAVATSDESGKIVFENLSVGTIDTSGRTSKTYYMKETSAASGYITPTDAVWKLVVTYDNGTTTKTLTAMNEPAKVLSLTPNKIAVTDYNTAVGSIKNELQYRSLSVKKVVSTNPVDADYVDSNRYAFHLYRYVDNAWQPVLNASFSVGNVNVQNATQDGGLFVLGNQETAVFNNLTAGYYKIVEYDMIDYGGRYGDFTLSDYTTNIYDELSGALLTSDNREIELNLVDNNVQEIRYENILNYKYDWQLIKKSSSTKKVLDGAKFKLQSMDGSTIYYGQSEQTGIVKWYSDDNYSQEATVVDGEYTLQEIAAPNGYSLSVDSWTILIDRVHGIDAYKSVAGDLSNQIRTTSDGNTTMVEFTFYNDVVYTLPETGGRGVYVYTIGGVLLMLGASLMLYKNKKNHKKAKI